MPCHELQLGTLRPILLGLPLYRRRRWVFDLQPMRRTAGSVGRAEPLRYDAFTAQRAGVPVDDGAVALEMLVEGDVAMSVVWKLSERLLTHFYGLRAQVLSIQFK
jgi:hypothetical protein